MNSFRTHYDNLKVARDAPDLVIRAAYRSLTQRFHPDKNPGDARAAQIMAVINRSYEILSDPQKRREHDAWIAQQEAKLRNEFNPERSQPSDSSPLNQPRDANPSHSLVSAVLLWPFKLLIRIFAAAPQLAFFTLLIGGIWIYDAVTPDSPLPPGPKPYLATPITPAAPDIQPERSAYTRPPAAPNGEPWPHNANYVDGYPILASDGLSEVTIDNGQNDSDVFVKLVSLDGPKAFPVRQFFIPAHTRFTLNDVSAGSYDIRYRDLRTGGLSRSESFQIEQFRTNGGTQYSRITMTLYKVQGGNFQTYNLAEPEF